MISIYAILSTLVLVLPMIYKKLKTCCDENRISYDITVHVGQNIKHTKGTVS